jgi:hypothetical protein
MVETHIVHSINHFPQPYAGHPKGWSMRGPAAGWKVLSQSVMKYFIFTLFLLILSNVAAGSDCVECKSSEDECIRVIVGNTVYIFYGKRSPCE